MKEQFIPSEYLDILQKKSFAHIATLMKDGSPQVTPVWIDYDGDFILVNSAHGRQKDLNMRRDQRVALSILDPDDPYRGIQIRGNVIEITEEGADDHIDKLSKKYTGIEPYQFREPGEVRVIYKVRPEHITVR
jgi:PPOX class probable F420-dependent enzyme